MVWGLVTLPDGTILFNERDAHDIVHLDPKTGAKKAIGTVPNVQSTDGEGGLTGLEINPVSSRHRPLALHHAHFPDGQPDRAHQVRPERRLAADRAPSRSC